MSSLGGAGFAHLVGLSAGDHGGGVVQEADGGGVFGEEPALVLKGPVLADTGTQLLFRLVAACGRQSLAIASRREAHFIDYEEIVAGGDWLDTDTVTVQGFMLRLDTTSKGWDF